MAKNDRQILMKIEDLRDMVSFPLRPVNTPVGAPDEVAGAPVRDDIDALSPARVTGQLAKE